MYSIQSSNIADLYKQALETVMVLGSMTRPRGFYCKELTNISILLTNPDSNILSDKVRKINKGFAAAEFLWVLNGQNDVETITKYNSKLLQFSDDGQTFFGAYGPRFVAQLNYIKKCLTDDPWSRQAIMTIWRENPPKTKDVPCTVALHFMRRPLNKLNLTVYMRSNDIWLGLPYDIHLFTCLQIFVAESLGLLVGEYVHIDGSLHAYEPDFPKIRECIDKIDYCDYNLTNIGNLIRQKEEEAAEYLRRKLEHSNPKNA